MTCGLLISMKKRMNYLKKIKGKERNSEHYKKYIEYRNNYNKLITVAKYNYYETEFVKYKKDPKKTWQTINKLLNKNNSSNKQQEFIIDSVKTIDEQEISNAFNTYFVNVGANLSKGINESKESYFNYLNNMESNPNTIYLMPCTEEEILKIIRELKPKTSSGYDKISNKLLKDISDSIIKPLTKLLNRSLVLRTGSKRYKNSFR